MGRAGDVHAKQVLRRWLVRKIYPQCAVLLLIYAWIWPAQEHGQRTLLPINEGCTSAWWNVHEFLTTHPTNLYGIAVLVHSIQAAQHQTANGHATQQRVPQHDDLSGLPYGATLNHG